MKNQYFLQTFSLFLITLANKSLEENNNYLEETSFPGIDAFNNFINNFNYDDEKRKKIFLPDVEKVVDETKYFEELKNNLIKLLQNIIR